MRRAVWLRLTLAALVAGGLVAQALHASRLLRVEHLLRAIELRTVAVQAGRAPGALLIGNLRALDDAESRRPHDVRLPIARGANLLLLGRAAAAIPVYERALAIQQRPEGHLNLGLALVAVGRREEARRQFELAYRLDPDHMRHEIPPSFR